MHVGGEDLDRPLAVLRCSAARAAGSRASRPPRRSRSPRPRREARPRCDARSNSSGNDVLFEHLERLLVAEEAGHADQQVAVERVELGRFSLERAGRSRRGRATAAELQPPLDASRDRARLVVGEVDARTRSAAAGRSAPMPRGGDRRRVSDSASSADAVLDVLEQHARHRPRARARSRPRRCRARSSACRRTCALSSSWTSTSPPASWIVADAARAVAAAAREDDRRSRAVRSPARASGRRRRSAASAPASVLVAEQQPPAGDDHLLLGRDQVDVVGLDLAFRPRQLNRHVGVAAPRARPSGS